MSINKIETGINVLPINRVDIWDVANRGIPTDRLIHSKNIIKPKAEQSEARKKFIDNMNA